jgi:hypothetical protein
MGVVQDPGALEAKIKGVGRSRPGRESLGWDR